MDIKTFILRLGLLCLFLCSGNGHAIPMVMGFANSEDAKGRDGRFVSVDSAHKSEPETDEMRIFALAQAQYFENSGIGELLGKYYEPFDFLHRFYSPFGFSLQDRNMEKFIAWASPGASEDIVITSNLVGFEDIDIDIAEFFAILGFDIMDWHRIMENPHTSGEHDPAPIPDGSATARLGQRKECLQRQREFSRKSDLHDNDCFEAGGFAGFNSSAGRSRISAIVNNSNADPNFRNNPGAGSGAGGRGSGGTSPGTSAGGGDGDNGSGSGGLPGTGTGEGEGGTGDSEVRPLPEPATPALLLLGLACVYYTRNRIRQR